MTKYATLWKEIKETGEVEFTVNKSIAPTVIQGVYRTKSAENAVRKKLGYIGWSKLKTTQRTISATHVIVHMKLVYGTAL